MTRYIDADALKAVFEKKSSEAVCGVELCKAIIFRINEAPTADAVPVIRCKDCAYYRQYAVGRYDCDNLYGMADAHEDGFCSRAERKEE